MSMKSSLESILRSFGHEVILQRRDQNTDDKNPGYLPTLEKHKVRFSIYNNRGLANSQTEAMEGLVNTTNRAYYFKADVCPYEGDRIYETDYRSQDGKTVWVIEQAVPQRGENGSLVYWSCGVSRILPN